MSDELERTWSGRDTFQGTIPVLSWVDWGKPLKSPCQSMYRPRSQPDTFQIEVRYIVA
jgi:hypothetical protein